MLSPKERNLFYLLSLLMGIVVIASNYLVQFPVKFYKLENLLGKNKSEAGGLSGEPLNKISNSLIKKFYKHTKGKITIIGVGGVNSGLTAYEKLKSGASLLQLYTGMVYEGPGIVKKIKSELIDILEKEKIKNISEIVGTGS